MAHPPRAHAADVDGCRSFVPHHVPWASAPPGRMRLASPLTVAPSPSRDARDLLSLAIEPCNCGRRRRKHGRPASMPNREKARHRRGFFTSLLSGLAPVAARPPPPTPPPPPPGDQPPPRRRRPHHRPPPPPPPRGGQPGSDTT